MKIEMMKCSDVRKLCYKIGVTAEFIRVITDLKGMMKNNN